MTPEQFKQEMAELENKYSIHKRELVVKYVDANNPYQIGDIITDHYHTIKITGIRRKGISQFTDCPEIEYYGIELKKDLTPTKNQVNTTMWLQNIKQ